jgi:signal transduction histidine kinase
MASRYRRIAEHGLAVAGIVSLTALAWPLHAVHPFAVAFALAVVTCLPWLWRERYPMPALAISGAGLVAAIIALHAYDWASVVAVVLLFFAAFDGDRRRSLRVGIVTTMVLAGVLVALIPALERSDDLAAAGTRVLAALGALVAGDLVRSRMALRAAAAERLERERAEQRDRAERQAAAERLRIARELHDTLAHALVAINVRSGVAAHLGDSLEAGAALTEIKQVSAQALRELRATLDVLRDPDTIAPRDPSLGLAEVPGLVARARAAGLDVAADVSLNGTRVPSVIDHAGFRIVQESLTNVLRHAEASSAQVTIAAHDAALDIDVTDDGRGGKDTDRSTVATSGHGLAGMAERVAAVGGRITAGPLPGDSGWRVRATLPLAPPSR